MMWVDDIVTWIMDIDDMLRTLDAVLRRLEHVGLQVAANKCTRCDTNIEWCGHVYFGGVVKHDPERLGALASMHRPGTAGELIQFL